MRHAVVSSRHLVRAHGQRRLVWYSLAAWSAFWSVVHWPSAGYSWHYFTLGAKLLTGSSTVAGAGLHVYAVHPELQIGPLALAIAVPFTWAGPTIGLILAIVALTALGLFVLRALVSAAEVIDPIPDPLLLVTGVCLLPVWAELATHFTHLDDALALGFAVAGLGAVSSDRVAVAGLFIAASIDCKPWAVAFLPLLLALTPERRRRGLIACGVGVLILWLPFVVADPRTASLGHFTIVNAADSALRALGVTTPGTPSWDRIAQAVLGLAVATMSVRRGRWPAVLLAGVAARLLLDPQTYPYYTAGLTVATAAIDLLRPGRRLPLWTFGAVGFYFLTTPGESFFSSHTLGLMRAAYCIAVLIVLSAPGSQAAGPARLGARRGASFAMSARDPMTVPSAQIPSPIATHTPTPKNG